MLRMASSIAAAWLLLAPAAAAATAPRSAPSGINTLDHSAQLYAQNNAVRNNPMRLQPSARRLPPQAQGPVKVYLLRGLLNVFSLGMDDLAAKLQADGIAATVTNHADADFVASRIVTTYNGGDHGPIVLIGHSLGADAIVDVATTLAHYNIPVALLVLFDGTDQHLIPANVATAINYTKHFMISPIPGSRTAVSNVDLSGDAGIDHLNIDTTPSLQAQTVNYVLQAASPAPPQPVPRRQ
ncbi:MAG TPA: alpha/beta hydrolase [Xanthobacteraceae bacterium]|nr:alpha/beta hydrolase [Xanthobacteraceae bacterium]